jgi:uncharacterized protein
MAQSDRLPAALLEIMKGVEPLAVAVSGGVDIMTLATAAHRGIGVRNSIFHAVSPACRSRRRVHDLAEAEGCCLRIIDAGRVL